MAHESADARRRPSFAAPAAARSSTAHTWRRTVPTRPGTYRLWDPDRAVNGLVQVFCARGGRLAVKNPCGCCPAFFVDMWRQPAFARAQWLGPIDVPPALPAALDLPGVDVVDGPAASSDHRVRIGRCLLGPHH